MRDASGLLPRLFLCTAAKVRDGATEDRLQYSQSRRQTCRRRGTCPGAWAARDHVPDKEDGDVRSNTTEAPRKTPRAAGERGFQKAPRWYSDERSHLPAEYAGRFRRMIKQAPTKYPQATAEYKTGMLFGVLTMTHMMVMALYYATMEGRVLASRGGFLGVSVVFLLTSPSSLSEYAGRYRRMIKQALTEYPQATADQYTTGILFGVFMMAQMMVMTLRYVTMEGRALAARGVFLGVSVVFLLTSPSSLSEYAVRFRQMIRQAPTEYPQATAEYKTGMLFGAFMMSHMMVMTLRYVTMERRALGDDRRSTRT